MTVLIVDDNKTNRKLLRVNLQREGHQTIEAGDGSEALEILNGQSVDAIISDILMPKMDGFRFCHQVRSTEKLRDVRFVIYTSTFTTSSDEKLALQFGADRFIRKPAPIKEILEAVESPQRLLRGSDPEPEANLTELTALQGYSKVLVKKLEHRNAELQLAKEELLRTNSDLVSRTNELQTAKARVESTARQLQSLFDNLDDVFFSLDMKERRLVQISPSCEKLYGLPRHAFFANPMLWKDLTLTADRNLIEQGVADLHAGKPWNGEHRIQRPGGGPCWVQSKLKPVLDHTGALVRIDGVVSDISERKNLEGQLLHSQKLEAVGRLAGGVAHDFNNLLVVILGYADLAMGRLEPDNPLRFQMEEVKAAGERATGLTRQLLAFSRKQILDPQILDLNALVTDAERWLKRLIGEDLELTTVVDAGLKPIRADSGQVEQVILNLAVNARDAMPNGGRLTIETANVELDESYAQHHAMIRPGKYVMLAVSDTGCGMSQEVQSHIFEPFFTTKEPGKGTGLGLATVYGIVKQSEGHIWVESELGSGTAFKIYLPPAERTDHATVRPGPPAEIPSGGETILVAEDEEAVRKLVVTVLRSKGYKVIEARDAEQALELWREYSGKINLLLTDTIMPGMDGPDLSQRLKVTNPDIKVIYMSGYTDDAIVLRELSGSGASFLQKPFGPEALILKVSETLNAT